MYSSMAFAARWVLERLPKVFFVSCWLWRRSAASDCIDNPSGLPASSSLQPSSSLRLKTKELSAITLRKAFFLPLQKGRL
jgi:hypothetical protein